MNLLDKKSGLKYLLICLSALILFSCNEPANLGIDPKNEVSSLATHYSDTFTLKSSVVLLQPLETTNIFNLQIGSFKDPIFGRITANSFSKVYYSLRLKDSLEAATYDSAVINFNLNGFYANHSEPITLGIHEVLAKSDSASGFPDPAYYTNSQVEYSPTVLNSQATAQKAPNANVLTYKLSDDIGRWFLQNQALGLLSTQEDFEKAFKGIAIISSNENTGMVSFLANGTSYIRIYYTNKDNKPRTMDYVIGAGLKDEAANKVQNFTQIIHDKSGTSLEGLQYNTAYSTETFGNNLLVQSATGVSSKITFPDLEQFIADNPKIAINQAEIEFYRTDDNSSGLYPLPDRMLYLFETDSSNTFIKADPSEVYNSSTFNRIPTGNPVNKTVQSTPFAKYDENPNARASLIYNTLTKAYSVNITYYLNSLMRNKKTNSGLLLFPDEKPIVYGPNKAMFGDANNTTNKMRLKIYYTLAK